MARSVTDIQIQNHFDIPVSPAAAWPILMNVPETAACFPGASGVEAVAENHYKGRVTVKLGPLTMVFSGNLHIESRNDAAHSAAIKAAWAETKWRDNANTMTQFALQEISGGTRVVMDSDLQLAGQVTQYGRGAGMISALSAQLIAMFAENLRGKIQAAGSNVSPTAAQQISGLGYRRT